jgi:hypothetical protein
MIEFLKQDQNCRIVLYAETDRSYWNMRDPMTLKDLGRRIHLDVRGVLEL